jgi:hypothetical protein
VIGCRMVAVALAIAASALHGSATAAGPIDTDGPDFVESSEAVGRGRFQFEANLVSERDRRRDITRTSTPTLLRFGLTETIEARIETGGRVLTTRAIETDRSTASANADTAIGLKWHAQDREATIRKPSIAWIVHFDMPSGTGELRGIGVRPSLRAVITWDLRRDWSFGLMPGIRQIADADGNRATSGVIGAVLGKRLSAKLRVFAELAAPQIAHARDGGVVLLWDAGIAYLIANDWQIGGRVGIGANRNTPNTTVLFAVAGRF